MWVWKDFIVWSGKLLLLIIIMGTMIRMPDAWLYDSGYMPLQLSRVVNSWVRNVSFESVSEAVTLESRPTCSAYNISITGNRGHSAVRAQGSSRVFIGKVSDESFDTRGHGQWHGCGVSKPSNGNRSVEL